MLTAAAWIAVAGASAPVAVADAAAVDISFAACERWLLDPASWSDDIDGFGRSGGLHREPSVPDVALPPAALRVAMHHWSVPIRDGGIYVTTSDQLPMCHLSGGGPFDLQPAVDALVRSPAWLARWKSIATGRRGDMQSQRFASRRDADLTMTLSYAARGGGRTDRVQLLATAQYHPGN